MKKNYQKITTGFFLLILTFSTHSVFANTQTDQERIAMLQEKMVELQIILADLLEQKRLLDLKNSATISPSSYAAFSYIFKSGVTDSQTNGAVSQLQQMLINDGFLTDRVDGRFGPRTAAAVDNMKAALGIFDQKYGEFNPIDLYQPESNKQTYSPKKITEFLGSDQLEFYSLPFPFDQKYIENISCNGNDVEYLFESEHIIFPITFPYDARVKKVSCNLDWDFGEKSKNFLDIYRKEVQRETVHITLNSNSSATYIAPKQSDIDRAAREKKMLADLYENADRKILIDSAFIKPVNSIITSSFGKTRIFNNSSRSYHSGTDFRAPTGTPLKATNDGEVILSQDLFYCGNTVIINHGGGIFSVYCHLSRLNVSEGQMIDKGALVGLSGATGRVSGPHLHLSIKYDNNGTLQFIDFLDMLNRSKVLE